MKESRKLISTEFYVELAEPAWQGRTWKTQPYNAINDFGNFPGGTVQRCGGGREPFNGMNLQKGIIRAIAMLIFDREECPKSFHQLNNPNKGGRGEFSGGIENASSHIIGV